MNLWLSIPRPNPAARMRLFCFPYAGGGSAIFRRWPVALAAVCEVCLVRLPGREARLRERPLTELGPLIAQLRAAIRPHVDQPYGLFGHSLGGLVAFELAQELRAASAGAPRHLFVSARRAPQCPARDPPLHNLPEADFRRELHKLGGMSAQVMADEELLSLLLPAVRADFTVAETYRYTGAPPLDCSITAFGGRDDPRVNETELYAWSQQTRCGFRQHLFAGGHFFIHTEEEALLATLAHELAGPADCASGGST